jgi:hypothetical protein
MFSGHLSRKCLGYGEFPQKDTPRIDVMVGGSIMTMTVFTHDHGRNLYP